MPAVNLTYQESRLKSLVRSGVSTAFKPFWRMIPRSVYLEPTPRYLTVALTRMCNIDCVFCAYQYATKEDKKHMSDEVFEKVVEDVKRLKIPYIMLSPNIGEPTLAPRFLEKIQRLRSAGARFIEMTTNGSLLHRVGIEAILKDGPDRINVSFIGFDKEMYERDARARGYEQTRSNVLDILRMNHEMGRPKIVNLWLRGDMGLDKLVAMPEMKDAKVWANEICAMTEVDDWNGKIKAEDLPEGYKMQEFRPMLTRRPCTMLFDLSIYPDGDLHVCSCRNVSADPDLHIGNIKTMSMEEAYSKIPQILERWESGVFPQTCQTCMMYNDPAVTLPAQFKRVLKGTILGSGVESAKQVTSEPVVHEIGPLPSQPNSDPFVHQIELQAPSEAVSH